MGQQQLNRGSAPNDGTGDSLYDGAGKINANFNELYGVTGQLHMIPIMASGMIGRTTGGAESGSSETAINLIQLATLDFDKDADEFAQFMVPMPESWDGGNCYAEFVWTSTGTGNVVWAIQGVAIGDGDSIDQAFEGAATVTDGVLGSADHMISDRTAGFSLGVYGDPGSTGIFQVYRDADNGSDTLDADARLIAVRLYITCDDYEDS